MTEKSRDLVQVTFMYLLTAAAGFGVAQVTAGHLMIKAAFADLMMTLVMQVMRLVVATCCHQAKET